MKELKDKVYLVVKMEAYLYNTWEFTFDEFKKIFRECEGTEVDMLSDSELKEALEQIEQEGIIKTENGRIIVNKDKFDFKPIEGRDKEGIENINKMVEEVSKKQEAIKNRVEHY